MKVIKGGPGNRGKRQERAKGKMIGRCSVASNELKELLAVMKEDIFQEINDRKVSRASVGNKLHGIDLDSPTIDRYMCQLT